MSKLFLLEIVICLALLAFGLVGFGFRIGQRNSSAAAGRFVPYLDSSVLVDTATGQLCIPSAEDKTMPQFPVCGK